MRANARETDPDPANQAANVELRVVTPTVAFDRGALTLTEGESVAIRIDASPTPGSAIRVDYRIDAGSHGLSGSPAGTVTIPADASGAELVLSVSDDAIDEPQSTVGVTVIAADGAQIGTPSQLTVTIRDDDPEPVLRIDGPTALTLAENGAAETITLRLDRPSASDLSVAYTLSGTAAASDLRVDPPSPAVIPAGSTTLDLTIAPIDDFGAEDDETAQLTLAAGSGYRLGTPGTASILITDDDRNRPPPSVRFALAGQRVSERAGEIAIAARLSRPSAQPVEVGIANEGDAGPMDYELLQSVFAFPAGSSEAVVTLRLRDDALHEDTETLALRLLPPAGLATASPSRFVLIVEDDDPAPAVSFSADSLSVAERDAVLEIPLRLDAPSGVEAVVGLRVDGTATPGFDYRPLDSAVRFAPGQTSATLRLEPLPDGETEGSETVILRLEGPERARLGTPAELTVTLHDGAGNGGSGGTGGGIGIGVQPEKDAGGLPPALLAVLAAATLLRRLRKS